MNLPCPTCQKPVTWTNTNKFRPFCSQHCQTIDLGAWANNEYVVGVKPKAEQEPEE